MADSDRNQKIAKREKVIAALLSENTLQDAATKAGVSTRTIRRWMKEDCDFRCQFTSARSAVVEHAVTKVVRRSDQAVEALSEVLVDSSVSATARISAARLVLELAIDTIQRDFIINRLDALESRMEVGR